MHRFLAPLFLLLTLSMNVSANVGPPFRIPEDRKLAQPRLQFKGIADYPDYVFVIKCNIGFRISIVQQVKDDKEFTIAIEETKRIEEKGSLYLYAIPKKKFDKLKKEDPPSKWIEGDRDGTLFEICKDIPTTIPKTSKEYPLIRYQVIIQEGELRAKKLEPKPSEDPKKSSSLRPIGIGVLCCLSLAWLGVWFVRRGSQKG